MPRFSFWIMSPERKKKNQTKKKPQPTNKQKLKQRCGKMSLDYAEYARVLTTLLLKYVDTFISYNQRKSQLHQNKKKIKPFA